MDVIEKPPKQGLAFKFFVIICIIILFALIIYVMFGPLPNQSKFLKKSGTSDSLNVNGNSILNGDVVIGGNTIINGFTSIGKDVSIQTKLSVPEIDLITSPGNVDIIQGSVSAKTGGTTEIKGTTNVVISDISGTNTIAKFTGNSKQTDFYGDVVLNDMDGSTSLILKNQSSSLPSYELLNNSSGNDNLLIQSRNGNTVRTLIDANSSGTIMTLLNSIVPGIIPELYIKGPSGNGRVFDDTYNVPPSSSGNFPNINVSGTSTLNTVNVSGNLKVSQGLDTVSPFSSKIATTEIYDWQDPATVAGRITADDSESYALYIQGKNTIQFAHLNSPDEIASFDVSTAAASRSNLVEPAFNLKGFMKYTLPTYANIGGIQYNSYTYACTIPTTLTYSGTSGWPGLPVGYLRNWNSTQSGANSLLVNISAVTNAGWRCPKRGIWLVTFNSDCDGISNTSASFGIGNITTSDPYGLNKTSSIVVIDLNQVVVASLNSGNSSGLAGKVATMKFDLIMELNPATNA